jgi:hypothetical protein
MEKFTQPSKEKVRDWFKRRQLNNDPPPAIEQIRIELGWKLVKSVLREDKPRSLGLAAPHILNLS